MSTHRARGRFARVQSGRHGGSRRLPNKRRRALLGCAAALLALAATTNVVRNAADATALGEELVINGRFDLGTEGWRTNNKELQRLDIASDGDPHAVIWPTVPGNAVLNDLRNTVNDAEPGSLYVVEAKVRAGDRPISGQLRVREVSDGTVRSHESTFSLKSSEWYEVRLAFTTSMPHASLDLNVLGWNMAAEQQLHVDDVSMRASELTDLPPVPRPTSISTPTTEPTPSAITPTATVSPTTLASPSTTPTSTPEPISLSTIPSGDCPFTLSERGVPSCGAFFGAAVGANADPAAAGLEANGPLGVRRTYYSSGQIDYAVNTASGDLNAGRLPWISFKFPHSWAEMAAGRGDGWARDIATRLSALDGPVWIAFHHEPENDGNIADWTRAQRRLAPIVRSLAPNVAYTIVVTGWHQFYGPNEEYSLDAIWPGDGLVDIVGLDPYNGYGVVKNGSLNTKMTDLVVYYEKIAPWAEQHDTGWAISETGLTDEAAALDPQWLSRAYDDMVERGGAALTYFDSELNSIGSWALDTSVKTAAFAEVLDRSPRLADAVPD